jgi:SAM-dependent methyltransferase
LDYHKIYKENAGLYDRLVTAEDYQKNLQQVLHENIAVNKKHGLEMGVGTGRVTKLIAPKCEVLTAYDYHQTMLDQIDITQFGDCELRLLKADHLNLPFTTERFDLCVAGWTICHLIDDNPKMWKPKLKKVFDRLELVFEDQVQMVIIETMGTGAKNPNPPEHLVPYYELLEKEYGFIHQCIRTDYCFKSKEEAMELVPFFFGKDMLDKLEYNQDITLPECTGLWFRG